MNAGTHTALAARIDFEALTWLAVVMTAVFVLVIGASLVRETNLALVAQAAEVTAAR
jgi:hypothetical protein